MPDNKPSLFQLPHSLDNALENLTDEPTKSVGTTLSDIWFLVFGDISHAAEKRKLKYAADLKKFRLDLEEKTSSIPDEKKIEPSIQVTAQAIDNSRYCVQDSILRSMFVSLISNSMNSDYTEEVHPSFSEMIKQMSALDGKVLQKFKSGPSEGFPLCDYRKEIDETSYESLVENIFLEMPDYDVYSLARSITSLERFGLLSIPPFASLLPEKGEGDLYQKFKDAPLYHELQDAYPNANIVIEHRKVNLTPLGRSFVKVCIPD